jgi:hypothetical protein
MFTYEPFIEEEMREFYEGLAEDQKRKYIATEADKLGHGGDQYIAKILGCSIKTIQRGKEELEEYRLKKN